MNAREWKPGDVAVTAKDTIALCHNGGQMIDQGGAPWSDDRFPDNLRSLVVIDPEDREQVERLGRQFHESDHIAPWSDLHSETRAQICDALQAALRSLITPPKPEEPLGLGAVVEDEDGIEWVRVIHANHGPDPWKPYGSRDRRCAYADIAAVKVLSEGVTA